MAVDKLVDSAQLDFDLTSVANAIRAKSGGSGQLAFPSGFVSEIGNIPSGGNFTLIGQATLNLEEYTNTQTDETIDTGINISNTDYAWGYITVTCDTAITTSTEWGATFAIFGRNMYKNMNVYYLLQKGSSTLSYGALINPSSLSINQGTYIKNGTPNVTLVRRAHATNFTKCRAGTYTIKAYGMNAI